MDSIVEKWTGSNTYQYNDRSDAWYSWHGLISNWAIILISQLTAPKQLIAVVIVIVAVVIEFNRSCNTI